MSPLEIIVLIVIPRSPSGFLKLEPKSQPCMAAGHVLAEAVGEASLQLHVVIDTHGAAQGGSILALECSPVGGKSNLLRGQECRHSSHGEGHGYAGVGLAD